MICIGISVDNYLRLPPDCLYTQGAIYNTCNKSDPGVLCQKGNCYTKMCNVLNKCPEVIMRKEYPFQAKNYIPTIIIIIQLIGLCYLLGVRIAKIIIYVKNH